MPTSPRRFAPVIPTPVTVSLAWESASQRGTAALTGRRDAVPYNHNHQ